jgi:hypothetical protein
MKRLWFCVALAFAASAHGQPAREAAPPGAPAKSQVAVITNPNWVRLPTADELGRYFPPEATSTGLVILECEVTAEGGLAGCVALNESPEGMGFGKAALKMSGLFRMTPRTRDGVPVGGAIVHVPLRFVFDGGVIPPPWLKPLTPEELQSVWPKGAPPEGGVAKLDCIVTARGQARNCSVVSETPAHSGFGAAAVKLAPSFRLGPPKKVSDHRPTEAEVQLTIGFTKPQPTQAGVQEYANVTSLHNAPWQAAPTKADMAAAWPAAAPAGLEQAQVRLQCGFSPDSSLTGCRLLSEEPSGYGFGAAALKLSEAFRTRGAFMDEALLAKARIVLSFRFVNPKTGGGLDWLTKPNWITFIAEDRMTALYPPAAADAGIKTGRGVVTCTVAAGGAMTACGVESEDPAGKGFGQAALAAIGSFVVNPWSDDGQPVEGARIRVPIRFNEAEPEPPPAPAPAK